MNRRRNTALAALFAALFILPPQARAGECDQPFARLAAGEPERAEHLVNIILALGYKGRSLDQAAAEVQARRYRELFPRERTVVISAGSAESITAQISKVLQPGESVHRLYVDSHGNRNELYYGVFNIVFLDEHQPYLQGPEEFSRVLGALKGRFAADASIVFEGCKLYPEEKNQSAEMSAKLLDLFGMSSGRVYANYTDGTNVQDDFIHPKFRDLHDWQSCAMVGIANALYPVTEAFSGVVDYGIANRGYLYTRVDAKTWCLDKARLMDMRY